MIPAVAGRPALSRPLLFAGMALALLGGIPGGATTLNADVEASTAQLRRAWAADPSTASLPFPQVVLLPSGMDANGACTPGAAARRPAPRAMACSARNQVLLQHDLLANAYNDYKSPAVSYWIAVGLAELIQPEDVSLSSAAANLQANCLAGVLLGAGAQESSATIRDTVVKAAGRAYGDGVHSAVGTTEQRAYAVLSGYGGTPSGCSSAEMASLSRGEVPEPAKLSTLAAKLRGNTDFEEAYTSQCRSQPQRPCPRPIASSLQPPKGSRP